MPAFKTVAQLNDFLADKSYVEGYAFSPADTACFNKFSLPDQASSPHAYRWYIHIAALSGVPVALAAASSASPAPAAAAPAGKAKKAKKAAAEEEEIDLGFGDEEEEIDLGFGDEEEEEKSGGAMSAKERAAAKKAEMEEAKQKALERLAKKEAKQRSLCSLEIKPWEEDQDLMALFNKIKTTVVRDGLVWGENCQLKPVAYGIKKICLTAVINQALSMDEIIEEMTEESFADEIQSMELTSMSLL